MTDKRLQELASETLSWFVQGKRNNDQEYWYAKDGRPDWVQELCYAAHQDGSQGGMFPDDWRYEFIVEALNALAESDDPDEIQLEADIYTYELTGWLHSRNDRYGYVDEASEEYGLQIGKDTTLLTLLSYGQIREKEEVLQQVRTFLEQQNEEE